MKRAWCRGKPIPTHERFWPKVAMIPFHGCWEWTGARTVDGYGQFWVSPERGRARAHRVSWEMFNGPIPSGLHVLHHCDNPSCVNPDHLFLGTDADNAVDRKKKGRCVGPAPERARSAIMTWDLVRQIREAAKHETQEVIGKRFGIHQTTVSNIVIGRTWNRPR